jgi:hypothetical protein
MASLYGVAAAKTCRGVGVAPRMGERGADLRLDCRAIAVFLPKVEIALMVPISEP